jgi:hypothetical protein
MYTAWKRMTCARKYQRRRMGRQKLIGWRFMVLVQVVVYQANTTSSREPRLWVVCITRYESRCVWIIESHSTWIHHPVDRMGLRFCQLDPKLMAPGERMSEQHRPALHIRGQQTNEVIFSYFAMPNQTTQWPSASENVQMIKHKPTLHWLHWLELLASPSPPATVGCAPTPDAT